MPAAEKRPPGAGLTTPEKKPKKAGVLGLFRGGGGGGGGTKTKSPPTTNKTTATTTVSDQGTTIPVPQQVSAVVVPPPTKSKSAASGKPPPPPSSSSPEVAATTATTTRASWFCRTKYFRQMCDAAFDAVDLDQSGTVDEKELYSGLLLIHLKFGCYAGPAACRPLCRDRARKVFERYDVDNSGCLDRTEFRSVMTVLFGNVFFRVLVQWSMTLMIVPMVAQFLVDSIECIWQQLYSEYSFVANMDEYSSIANHVEVTIETISYSLMHRFEWMTPYTNTFHKYLEMIPESAWEAIPLAIISTILGMVVVPWCIFQVDDFFQRVAEKDTTTMSKVKRA